jgi:hypothetical protein
MEAEAEARSVRYIVARYNEDISWTDSLSPDRIIYNKGDPSTLSTAQPSEVTTLPNMGRESHTYLTYIIENYDNLPDVCVFTQGNIADHCGSNDANILRVLAAEASDGSVPAGLSRYRLYRATPTDEIWGRTWNRNFNFSNYKKNTFEDFWQWFERNIAPQFPNPIYVYPNGIFAVTKARILSHTKDYYKQILDELSWHIDPIDGHFAERSWFHMFYN